MSSHVARRIECLAVLVILSAPPVWADEVAVLARDLSARSDNVAPEYPQFGDLTLCGPGGSSVDGRVATFT